MIFHIVPDAENRLQFFIVMELQSAVNAVSVLEWWSAKIELIFKRGNMTEKELQAYKKGYSDAVTMKENADGCKGCAFESISEWEMPCTKCKRNSKDYWRAKVD